LLNEFKIAETDQFREKIRKTEFKRYYDKIHDYIYPQLKKNPFFGKNIKKLKGEFADVYRYRVGNIRLFYIIEKEKVLVIMIDIETRKDSY
jgi:mRNA interferase RelE/StbE